MFLHVSQQSSRSALFPLDQLYLQNLTPSLHLYAHTTSTLRLPLSYLYICIIPSVSFNSSLQIAPSKPHILYPYICAHIKSTLDMSDSLLLIRQQDLVSLDPFSCVAFIRSVPLSFPFFYFIYELALKNQPLIDLFLLFTYQTSPSQPEPHAITSSLTSYLLYFRCAFVVHYYTTPSCLLYPLYLYASPFSPLRLCIFPQRHTFTDVSPSPLNISDNAKPDLNLSFF